MRRFRSLLFLLVAPLVVAQDDKDLKPPFTFALYGDDRDGYDVHRKICAGILKSDARFIVQTGDLVLAGDSEKLWNTFREITKDLRAKKPMYPCKGNHDKGSKGIFEKEFGLAKSYYDKLLGPIHFFFLDTNQALDQGEQRTWFEQTVTASKAPHKIVVMHEPPFTMVRSRTLAAEQRRKEIHTLFAQLKVCAVFCGHDHNFYTTVRDDVRYVITGGGGAPLYEMDQELAEKGDLWKKFHHYLLCRVEEKKIAAQVFDEDGKEAADLKFAICGH